MRKTTIGTTALLIAIVTATPIAIQNQIEMEQTKATMKQKEANRELARKMAWAGFGWQGKDWECLYKIFTKESRYDHLAKNQQGSSAYGIAQRIGETSKDPTLQILSAYKYINKRYKGKPCLAWRHHQLRNWY